MNSMADVLTQAKARTRLYVQLTFGFVFLVLIGLYTFSHNANLMQSGTSENYKIIGMAAALMGEAFVLYAYGVSIFSAGAQKAAALLSDLAMLGVLLANTIVDYANVSGQFPPLAKPFLEVYATFGAPTLIVVVLVAGLHFIQHTDHAVQFHSATITASVAEQEIETAAILTARDQMTREMTKTEHTDKVREAAGAKVVSIIDRITAKKSA